MKTTSTHTTGPDGAIRTGDQTERYDRAFSRLDAPFAFVDLDAMWQNARDLLRRAAGTPIRVASKSIRCRQLLRSILDRDAAFRGVMTFTLPETLWLASHGFEDLLLAYPTANRAALEQLGRLDVERPPIIAVDCCEQLDLIDAAAGRARRPTRLCIEVDMSYWLAGGRIRIGAKRSPIRTPEQAAALAREITSRPGFEVAGIMGYEAQVAGLGDRQPGAPLRSAVIGRLQRASISEIAERRRAIVKAVAAVAPVELVNAGGTGSLESSASEPAVTEVTAGSGFYAPALFDHYSRFRLKPAAMYALPVVRRPGRRAATVLGGGYLASGPGDALRLPVVHLPPDLRLDRAEGAGEVQTPLIGTGADRLQAGDVVYLRHAKAGELCERFDRLHLISGDRIVDELPTYRGEGKTFL